MSAMTIVGVRDDLRRLGYNGYANAIDAHLITHAQMVEKVREVIAELRDHADYERECVLADKLARAIGDSHG